MTVGLLEGRPLCRPRLAECHLVTTESTEATEKTTTGIPILLPLSVLCLTTVGQNPRGLRRTRKLPFDPSTTDHTDFTDEPISIRVIRAIRGQKPRLIGLRRQPRWDNTLV